MTSLGSKSLPKRSVQPTPLIASANRLRRTFAAFFVLTAMGESWGMNWLSAGEVVNDRDEKTYRDSDDQAPCMCIYPCLFV